MPVALNELRERWRERNDAQLLRRKRRSAIERGASTAAMAAALLSVSQRHQSKNLLWA
jgi:hypothetical protein